MVRVMDISMMRVINVKRTRTAKATLILFAALNVSALIPATAAEFEPVIRAGITYTDNIFLQPEDIQHEIIYRLEPSFAFTHEASRLSVDVDYLLQSLWYDELGENEIFHQYDASVKTVIAPDVLWIEFGGDRSQSIRDRRLPIPQSNIPISTNRQDRDEYFVSPTLQSQLGDTVALKAQYRQSWIDYSERDIQGLENRDAYFSLDNYSGGRGLTWALNYVWGESEYDDRTPWENQRATAELGFWAGAKLRFFGSGGKESAWDSPLDSSLEDTIWEAGFAYTSGDRVTAEFAAGERSFGSSWRGNLNLAFRRGNMRLSYAETPNTDGRTAYRSGGMEGGGLPPNDLSSPGSTERFVRNRLDWTLNLEFRRASFTANVYDENRTDRTTADGVALSEESAVGARISVSYEVGPRTDIRATGSWREREFDVDDTSEIITALLAADYKLGAKATLTLEVRHDDEQGEGPGIGRDYRANTASVFVTWAF